LSASPWVGLLTLAFQRLEFPSTIAVVIRGFTCRRGRLHLRRIPLDHDLRSSRAASDVLPDSSLQPTGVERK
jgi:hypothetical protein